ncbi:MAG: class II aldolase/adducin family protein [Nitrososphaerota archaeon]|nr:class II aldolase/adducin family protein [Nitrososphaerota archaeon]
MKSKLPAKVPVGKSKLVELKETLIAASQILYGENLWEFWGEGHPSMRIEGTEYFLLQGHRHDQGMGMGDVRNANDVNVMDLEGRVVEGRNPPMDETFIHAAIYKARPGVNGVAYTHPIYSKVLASSGRDLRAVHHWAWIFGERVPTLDTNGPIRSWEKAQLMMNALGKRNSLMLWNSHGIVTVGKSVKEAVVLNVIFEKSAKVQYMSELLGEPKTVATRTQEQIDAYVDTRVEILWNHLVRKHWHLGRSRHRNRPRA